MEDTEINKEQIPAPEVENERIPIEPVGTQLNSIVNDKTETTNDPKPKPLAETEQERRNSENATPRTPPPVEDTERGSEVKEKPEVPVIPPNVCVKIEREEVSDEDEDEQTGFIEHDEISDEGAGDATGEPDPNLISSKMETILTELDGELEHSEVDTSSEEELISDGSPLNSTEKVEDRLKCLICRAKLVTSNPFDDSSHLMDQWKEHCAETVCELLFHSELHPFKYYFQNGGYCSTCQKRIWDVDFAWRKLVLLRQTIDEISTTLRQNLVENYCQVQNKSSTGIPDVELIRVSPPDLCGNYSYDEVIEMIYKVQENSPDFYDINCDADVSPLFPTRAKKYKEQTAKRSKPPKTQPGKRKVGRPKKHFSPLVTTATNIPKRPRGRPRKYRGDDITIVDSKAEEKIPLIPEVLLDCEDVPYETEEFTDNVRKSRRKASQKLAAAIQAMETDNQSCDEDVLENILDDESYMMQSDTDFEYEEYVKEARKERKRERKARRREAKRLKKMYGDNVERHQREPLEPGRISCKVKDCDKKFVKESTMLLHVRRFHDGEKNPFLCVYCDQTFETRNEFRRHQNVHPEYNIKDYHYVKKSFEFTCKVCSQGYDKEEELQAHSVVHTGRNPFLCCHCEGEFSNSIDLRNHMSEHHPDPDTPKCEICGKIFTAAASKKIHMRLHLAPQELPKCPVCQYTCYSQSALKNHMMSHSTERAFQCDTCGKTYKNVEGLRYHTRNHTGERPHKCQLCGKGFRQSGHLKRHEEVHSGLKKHICSHCGKAWASIDNLKAHEKIHTRDPNHPIRRRPRKSVHPVNKKPIMSGGMGLVIDERSNDSSTASVNHEDYQQVNRLFHHHSSAPNAPSNMSSHSSNASPPAHLISHHGGLLYNSQAQQQAQHLLQQSSQGQPLQVPNLSHMNFRVPAPQNFSAHGFVYNSFNNPNF